MMLFFLIMIISYLAGLFLPWWALIPIVFFLCFWLAKRLRNAFLVSFCAIFSLWLALNFYQSFQNDHILSNRVAELFGLGEYSLNWLWIILLSPLPGAITAGFAGAAGYLTKKLLFKKN